MILMMLPIMRFLLEFPPFTGGAFLFLLTFIYLICKLYVAERRWAGMLKVFLTLLALLVLFYGLMGGTPHFSNKLRRVLWGGYWILVSLSLLVCMWVDELPRAQYVTLFCVGHSWFIVPLVLVTLVLVIVCVILIAVGLYSLWCRIFTPLSDKMQERKSKKESIQESDRHIGGNDNSFWFLSPSVREVFLFVKTEIIYYYLSFLNFKKSLDFVFRIFIFKILRQKKYGQ